MTRTQSLKRSLVNGLDACLKEHGYRCRKTHSEYRKEAPPFYRIVSVGYVVHPGVDFDAMLHLCLGHGELEQLSRSFDKVQEELGCDTCSLVGELGNIAHALGYKQYFGNRRWTIKDEQDVETVCASMMEALLEVAFPFFERYSSLAEILAVCSQDNDLSCTLALVDKVRAQTAIAAAYLLGNRVLFDQLVKDKMHYLYHVSRQQMNFDPADFGRLAEGLSRNWQ